MRKEACPPGLARVVGKVGLFTMSFGGMVGSAWIVILGQWLAKAGPLGAALGLDAGAVLMILVSLNYAELAARMPAAGGEIVYALEVFGPTPAFFTGWALTLPFLAVTVFEGIALSWLLALLFPGLGSQVAYHVLGADVTWSELTVGAVGLVMIAVQNYRGVRNSVAMQKVLTVGFFVLALSVLGAAIFLGRPANLAPLVKVGGSPGWGVGALTIFSSGLVWFSGFQAIPQMMDERSGSVSYKAIAVVMAVSVAVAAAFYDLAILAVSMAKPWGQLVHAPLPTLAALQDLAPGGMLAKIVLLAGALAVLKAWNSTFTVTSRTLFVQARAGFLPRPLARVHPRFKTPSGAVLALAAVDAAGVAAGKGAMEPLVDTCGVFIASVMVMALLALLVLKLRRTGETPAYSVPGGVAGVAVSLAGLVVLAAATFIQPFVGPASQLMLDSILFLGWLGAGACVWALRRRAMAGLSAAETRLLLVGQV